jgi:taurine dioxygenase
LYPDTIKNNIGNSMKLSASSNISPYLGIEVQDIDLAKPVDTCDLTKLLQQFDTFHLLVIRNQKLSEEQLIKVSKIFGEPVPALIPTFRLEAFPLITKHSNAKNENQLPTGVVAPEHVFHADSYFTANPNKATLFYSLKSPTNGGETNFVNMCFAYDNLDETTKKFIANKKAIYKNAYTNQPPVSHPLVRVHPVTRRQALFVNIHRALGIDGLDQEKALNLLQKLYSHATNPEFVYHHQWQDGDLLVWNNVTTMHCATAIDSSQERLLYRILTKGCLPVS